MARRVVKYYFGVQNFPKGRVSKNYVQEKRQRTFVNFVNKAFLSFPVQIFWQKSDSSSNFAKKYLLKRRESSVEKRKRLNLRAAGARAPNKTCRFNLFVGCHFAVKDKRGKPNGHIYP